MRTVTLLAASLLALSLSHPSGAATTCREGDDQLSDQRALDTLRATAESACPCASYTGGPGLNRNAYLKCIRPVLRTARDTGALPDDCARTGKQALRLASCGSSKATCGEVRSDAPAGCRLRSESRCRDRGRVDATSCADEPFCADVVEWSEGTCLDPRALGPFTPGMRMVTFTKPSAVDPTQERTLETAIWYPAVAGSAPIDSAVGAVVDAPLATGDGPWPVVMFSHGSCGYPLQSPFLTALLASWGFVVAAPPHPGNTIYEFPNCGTPSAQLASYVERPRDVIFVLDRLLGGSGGAAFLDGALDADRIGVMGHSFGGLTTYLATALDPRFKVAVPLAPAIRGVGPLHVPSLTMLGTIDSVIDNPAARNIYAQGVSPRYLVEIEHAGHYAFSSFCFPASDCNPPVTLTQDEAHALVLRYVLPFLEVHLVGDARFAPLLGPPSRPGLVYQAAP